MAGVPLNIMCSKRWAMPVMPGRSLELPTWATQPPAMVGSSWRSTRRTDMPLARVFWRTGTFWAGNGREQNKSTAKAEIRNPKSEIRKKSEFTEGNEGNEEADGWPRKERSEEHTSELK